MNPLIVAGRHVYLDANVLIAAVERSDCGALALLDAIQRGACAATTSELTLAEVLTGPLARREAAHIAAFEALFMPDSLILVVPVSRDILRRAAKLPGLDLPDAIHVATAILTSCDVMASDDQRLQLPATIERVGLAALGRGSAVTPS